MGVAHDFTLVPVHAHVNLVGWVSMFLAGLFYHAYPDSDGGLARIHALLAIPGLLVLAPGIFGAATERPWGEPVAIVGSLLTMAGLLVFTVVVFRATRR